MESEGKKGKGRTWFIDIDGVIFEHNKYLKESSDIEKTLPGINMLFNQIPEEDNIVLVTARDSIYREKTISSLNYNGIRFDYLLMNLPTGARILINDAKPDGTKTAFSYNISRDTGIPQSLLEKMILG